jgi:hypothetical protein
VGIPIVVKANTSIKGLITTDGWKGYTIPGHELVAPKDATIIAKLRAAGVVILEQTNMPDFAACDTNRSTAYGRTGNAYDVRFSPGGFVWRHCHGSHLKFCIARQWNRGICQRSTKPSIGFKSELGPVNLHRRELNLLK